MEVEVEESGEEIKLEVEVEVEVEKEGEGPCPNDKRNDCPSSDNSRIHRKWKGFCFYAPPPLRYNPAQKVQPTSFNSGPMQLCTSQNNPKQSNKSRVERERKEEPEEKEKKKESIDTIIENEYTDEMSFLVNKISLTEDDNGNNSFMPYIY